MHSSMECRLSIVCKFTIISLTLMIRLEHMPVGLRCERGDFL